MKALIYEKHDEINLNYIVNLVGKIEHQRISKVSLVIVEVELFLKLREEGMKNGFFFSQYWWQKNRFSSGIKVNNVLRLCVCLPLHKVSSCHKY